METPDLHITEVTEYDEQQEFQRLFSFLLFICALWLAGKLFARAGSHVGESARTCANPAV